MGTLRCHGISSENSPDRQTWHTAHHPGPGQELLEEMQNSVQGSPELLWLKRGGSQPPSRCTPAAAGEHRPSPPPSASSQTTRAAQGSHSCLPSLVFPLRLLFYLSSAHKSISSTADSRPPAPRQPTAAPISLLAILSYFGYSGPRWCTGWHQAGTRVPGEVTHTEMPPHRGGGGLKE